MYMQIKAGIMVQNVTLMLATVCSGLVYVCMLLTKLRRWRVKKYLICHPWLPRSGSTVPSLLKSIPFCLYLINMICPALKFCKPSDSLYIYGCIQLGYQDKAMHSTYTWRQLCFSIERMSCLKACTCTCGSYIFLQIMCIVYMQYIYVYIHVGTWSLSAHCLMSSPHLSCRSWICTVNLHTQWG